MKFKSGFLAAFLVFAAAPLLQDGLASGEVVLAENNKACLPVLISEQASDRVQKAAKNLAYYLGRMSGAKFVVETNAATAGIVVGVASNHCAALPDVRWSNADPTDQERYILRSLQGSVFLIGATDLAVEHAVWDFLYRLGYRQYFPTPAWEIIPKTAALSVCVDADERPSFWTRIVGYSFWDYNKATWEKWIARNRAVSPFELFCGHHYQAIRSSERKAFEEHPEYLALVGGKRSSDKFCISNPDLRRLVVRYALRYFEKNPGASSISMEPSDGGGWCECDACQAMGSISDRAVALANEVARAVQPLGKVVGMLAYNQHAPPPSIRAESNIVVRVTTHQARGNLTLAERVQGWFQQGALTGISEAYCTFVWDWFLPARQNGSDLPYIRETIPRFYKWGARVMGGWSADSWGPVGLGNYLIARLLWDVTEADRIDELVDDFLDRCFGPARLPAEKFYRLIYRFNKDDKRPMLSEHMIGQMYRFLAEARELAPDAAVRERVDDLVLYTRYVELFFAYQNTQNESEKTDHAALDAAIFGGDIEPAQTKSKRQAAFEKLVKFACRIRKTEMVESRSVYTTLHSFDDLVHVPKEASWGIPADKNPWISDAPFAEAERVKLIRDGIAGNKLFDFEPLSFSDKLVPATPLGLAQVAPGNPGSANRQRAQRFYTWVAEAPGTVAVEAVCGLYEKDRGPVKITLYSPLSVNEFDHPEPVATTNAPPDGKTHLVTMATPYSGLHWVDAVTLGDRAAIKLQGAATLFSGIENPRHWPVGAWSLYFYVPLGSEVVAGYASECAGRLLNGDGRSVFAFDSMAKPGYFSVKVQKGQDGCLWKFDACHGQRLLMTVPPYLAQQTEDLLLPAEVVERDKR